jgi:fructuronate reductase
MLGARSKALEGEVMIPVPEREAAPVATGALCAAALPTLPVPIARPRFALDRVRLGVVHFGPGAFHRAHQAYYLDDALLEDPRWGVCGVSLKSTKLRDVLAGQDGLYTVVIRGPHTHYRVIGCLREQVVAAEATEHVLARLAAADTAIASLTITEKGYCLRADGTLDFSHPDIVADLASPRAPVSAIGFLVEALRRRRAANLPAFTTISCDNLVDNGGKLGHAVVALARAFDVDLGKWIEAEAAFPRTMVDSIVPATDAATEREVAAALGREDRWPVQREAFAQWVVEDRFCNATPDWQAIGVTVTTDVAAFERAKLRLLNGAHSTLAYLGSLAGHATVVDAMRDAKLAAFVERLMREDIRPNVPVPAAFDLDRYIDDILNRLRNPAMQHQLSQIAWDGSQKLPFRILGTIRDALGAQRPIANLCKPVAAWFHFVRRAHRDGRTLVDPLAETLYAAARQCNGDSAHDVARFLTLESVFANDLPQDARFVVALRDAYTAIGALAPGTTATACGRT